jgi:serine O-acetyltransferase
LKFEPLTWKQTLGRLRTDHARLLTVLAAWSENPPRSAFLHPSFVCVFFYRISSHFLRAGHRYIARFFWHLNSLLTGADIPPEADFGEGLVIVNPAGMSVMAKSGRNLTLMPLSGLGGELGRGEDVGAGPGLPLLGDDVILEPHSGVLGPVRIGDRARVCGVTVVTKDIPDDTIVEGPSPKFIRRRDLP